MAVLTEQMEELVKSGRCLAATAGKMAKTKPCPRCRRKPKKY